MKIKTSCVRCGKIIEGTGPYCHACAAGEKAAPAENASTRRPRSLLPWGIVLCLLALGAFFVFQGREEAPPSPVSTLSEGTSGDVSADMPGATQQLAVPETSSGASLPLPPPTPETVALENPSALPSTSPEEPIPPFAGEAESNSPPDLTDGADIPIPLDTADKASAAENTASGAADAEMSVQETSVQNASVQGIPGESGLRQAVEETGVESEENEAAPAEETEEAVAATGIASPVWIYYAKEPGKDERYKAILEKKGYTDVTTKGEWKTKYALNYIFYRPKDREGLQRLVSSLNDLDFKAFHHLDSATSPKLRGYFADNPNLEFLLILQ